MEISSEGRKKSRNPRLGWICRDGNRDLYLVLKTSDKEPTYNEKKNRWNVYDNLFATLSPELYPEVGQGKKKEFRAETRNPKPRYKIEEYNISKGTLEEYLNKLSDKDYEIVSTTMTSDIKHLYFIIKYYD